jgi:hypothetical protein
LTTGKKLNRQKLRNAEYYDFQVIQDELYEQSKRNEVFTHLVELITMRENSDLPIETSRKTREVKQPVSTKRLLTIWQNGKMNSLWIM